MSSIGRIHSIWRYPVKSMRGEELDEAFMSFSGIYGDRMFAFTSSASPKGFPFLTAREQQEMLRYRPRFRDAASSRQPPNLSEAKAIAPGLTAVDGTRDLMVDVQTPSGETLPIDDAMLLGMLTEGLGNGTVLTLLRSDRAMTDCRPISLFSVQTAQQLARELGVAADQRRFRANLYLDLDAAGGFGEDALVGRSVRIGSNAVIFILERDPRCKMITLDPDTGAANPEVLRKVVQSHDGTAGVYGAVLVEGSVRKGDAVELLD
jgi:MOSC domain-containing protein